MCFINYDNINDSKKKENDENDVGNKRAIRNIKKDKDLENASNLQKEQLERKLENEKRANELLLKEKYVLNERLDDANKKIDALEKSLENEKKKKELLYCEEKSLNIKLNYANEKVAQLEIKLENEERSKSLFLMKYKQELDDTHKRIEELQKKFENEKNANELLIKDKNSLELQMKNINKKMEQLEKELKNEIQSLKIALNNKIDSNRKLLKINNDLKEKLHNSNHNIKEYGERESNKLKLEFRNDLNEISSNENDKIKRLEKDLEKEKQSNKLLLIEKNDLSAQLINATLLIQNMTDNSSFINEEENNCRIELFKHAINNKEETIREQNNTILELRQSINSKDERIQLLQNKINNYFYGDDNNDNGINNIIPGEKVIGIEILSTDNKIQNYVRAYKDTELLVRVEEKLYSEFQEYKEKDTYFMLKGMRIKRFKTLKENNIKNGDVLLLNILDE